MQLNIRATGENAGVLTYLLAKNPNNLYERKLDSHLVRMFFSRFADDEIDTTIFVTPDPIELSRNQAAAYDIASYINDREFTVSSIFCSLIRKALGTALNGKPKEEYLPWVKHKFHFDFTFGPLASDLNDNEIGTLFEPLGFKVGITYGEAEYESIHRRKSSARMVNLKGMTTLQTGLRQLFVLIPVLDNYKHYYIDDKEVEKISRYGEGWLDCHPEKTFILKRALRFKEVYGQLEETTERQGFPDQETKKTRLNDLRYEKIIDIVKKIKEKRTVVDMGSGEGKLSLQLGFVPGIEEILAIEPSAQASLYALKRFEKNADQNGFTMPKQHSGSLFYEDERLHNKDIIILCEVIEHIAENRLDRVMDTILQSYCPKALIITTPNAEYNEVYGLNKTYRHPDHRFEWTRKEFRVWCQSHAEKCGYTAAIDGIGEEHQQFGCPTQLCVFTRKEGKA